MRETVEIHRVYTGEDLKKYKRFQLFRRKKGLVNAVIWLSILGGLYLIFYKAGWLYGALLIAFGFLFKAIAGWLINRKAKKYQKKLERLGGIEALHRIEKNQLVVETNTNGTKTTLETSWTEVVQVIETEDEFYVYMKDMETFILPKKSIVAGTARQARQMLWEGNRYKYRKMIN